MKQHFTALVLVTVLSAGCGQHTGSPSVTAEEPPVPQKFDHAWVMSSDWVGFMGVAIALTKDRYYYWFYSDVIGPDGPEYPITGTYTYSDGHLRLQGPKNELYSTSWVVVANRSRPCLWAERDIGDFPRMLIPDKEFSPTKPFRNQPILKAEHDESSISAKAAPSASSSAR